MSLIKDIEKNVVSGVDFITGLPGRIERQAGSLNDKLIKVANRISGKAESKARENLKRNKIQSTARGWIDWGLNNPIFAGVAILIIIWVVRRF